MSRGNENIVENRFLKTQEVIMIVLSLYRTKQSRMVQFIKDPNFCLIPFVQGKRWFGDDGRIMALPNPIKESSTRPPLFHMEEELDPALQTVYRKVKPPLPPHTNLMTHRLFT